MASSSTREKYDFGRNTRTQFELSEAGENNLIYDEIQFQIDRYHSASSNEIAKESALQALIDIFSDKVTRTVKYATRGYIRELFRLLSDGSSPSENVSRLFVALILVICRDTDGSFDQTFNLPIELVNKILDLRMMHRMCNTACMCSESQDNIPTETAAANIEDKGFRRKRKFGAVLSSSAEPAIGSSRDQSSLSSTNAGTINGCKPQLIRAYGSVRASSEVSKLSSPMSILSSAASPSSSVVAASDPADNYWFEEPSSFSEPPMSVPTVSLAAPSLPVNLGGFHKKRKLANQAKRLPVESEVPASAAPELDATRPVAPPKPIPQTILGSASSALYDKLSAVYDTFMCKSCCAVRSSDSTQAHAQENELLQLVLVNCYLSAKVQSLASVKLDIFQSADSAPKTEVEAQNHDQHAQPKAQSAHSAGGVVDVPDDGFQGIRSPDDPTSAASSSFYRRQAEALSHFQRAMLSSGDLHDKQRGGGSSYLLDVCWQLAATVRDLDAVAAADASEHRQQAANCANRVTTGKLWLILGVLDSACFRCPPNQREITELEVEDSSSVPGLLVQLLEHITPQLMVETQNLIERELSIQDAPVAPTASPDPTLRPQHRSHPCTPATSSRSKAASMPSSAPRRHRDSAELPVEWKRFQGLFHEVPILRTHHVVAVGPANEPGGGDSAQQAQSQSCSQGDSDADFYSACSQPYEGEGECEQAAAEEVLLTESIRAVIGMPELCTAALKTLISITNDNRDAARGLVEDSEVLSWAVAMLAWCTAWRCCLENRIAATAKPDQLGASVYVGSSKALSPDETRLERFVLDMMLHLQSLLRNLSEYSAPAVAGVNVWASLRANEHIRKSLPQQSGSGMQQTLVDAYVTKSCPTVHCLLDPCSQVPGSATLCDLLVEILLLETREQLRDLEDTDEAINLSATAAAAPPAIQDASAASVPVATTPSNGNTKCTSAAKKTPDASISKTATNGKGSVALLPIAELTVSAYAALLLQTLALETSTLVPQLAANADNKHALIASPGYVVQSRAAVAAGAFAPEFVSDTVTARLPRRSWWLCSRVLKAFLSLQGQTGIMLLDNLSAVSRAVQWMARQDEPAESLANKYDSPSGNHAPLSSTAMVRSNATKQVSTADLQERIDFTAEDDFFTDSSTTGAAVKAAGAAEKGRKAGKWVWDGSDYTWRAADDEQPQPQAPLVTLSQAVPERALTSTLHPVAAVTREDRCVELFQNLAGARAIIEKTSVVALPNKISSRPAFDASAPKGMEVETEAEKQRTARPSCAPTGRREHSKVTTADTRARAPAAVIRKPGNDVHKTAPAKHKEPAARAPAVAPDLTKEKEIVTRPAKQIPASVLPPQQSQYVAEVPPTESSGWRGKRKLSGVIVSAVKK